MPKRPKDQLRPISITPHYLDHAEGSVLIVWGDTRVICTASVEDRIPKWLLGKKRGWVTAEYDMLPRATHTRNRRDSHAGKVSGRTQEIGRLIGRSLRAAVDLQALGERAISIDCDVIQADGGTRTAAITGGWVALGLALELLKQRGEIETSPLISSVSAVSVGILENETFLDLDYDLDSHADVDMNIVMAGANSLVEVQGTAEGQCFSPEQLNTMLALAFAAQPKLEKLQRAAVASQRGDAPLVLDPSA